MNRHFTVIDLLVCLSIAVILAGFAAAVARMLSKRDDVPVEATPPRVALSESMTPWADMVQVRILTDTKTGRQWFIVDAHGTTAIEIENVKVEK